MPSYVSLLSALSIHGMIEQLPQLTWAVSLARTQRIRTSAGLISVHHIDAELFGGFVTLPSGVKVATPEPFVLEGEDWFALSGGAPLDWAKVQAVVEAEQARVAAVLADIAAGRVKSPLGDVERFDLVLGLTGHAVYHAGQVQLLKRLRAD